MPTPTPSEAQVIRATMRGVVKISTDKGEGTGFILRHRGAEALILTNAHVVEGAKSVSVATLDGKTSPGRVLARDEEVDLAVISVQGLTAAQPLPLGDSESVQVGDPLYVIGFPLGSELAGEPSVTRGVVSGRRNLDNVAYIQTDAAMNPGNSGGPVINQRGEVIGVATAGIRRDGLIQGINFAIPAKVAGDIFELLLNWSETAADAADDRWTPMATAGAPVPREAPAAVWTGKELIIWGGRDSQGLRNDGARYDPSTDTWSPLPTERAPTARSEASVIWTGRELLIWGGIHPTQINVSRGDGAKYDPQTNRWTPISPAGAPSGRRFHLAVWTGREMLVWGGHSGQRELGDGARYDPETNTWRPISADGAPSPRNSASAVWTGTELIVWGGNENNRFFGDGARYNPASDTWTPLPATGAPDSRCGNARWTGSEMIVWSESHECARYNPGTNTWTRVSTSGLRVRTDEAIVWTGRALIFWGGSHWPNVQTRPFSVADGATYSVAENRWSIMPSTGAPSARFSPAAVWTGQEMIVWGGQRETQRLFAYTYFGDGGRFNPASNRWSPLPSEGAPTARAGHAAVWTGREMIVWGGRGPNGVLGDGARYVPPSAPPWRQQR